MSKQHVALLIYYSIFKHIFCSILIFAYSFILLKFLFHRVCAHQPCSRIMALKQAPSTAILCFQSWTPLLLDREPRRTFDFVYIVTVLPFYKNYSIIEGHRDINLTIMDVVCLKHYSFIQLLILILVDFKKCHKAESLVSLFELKAFFDMYVLMRYFIYNLCICIVTQPWKETFRLLQGMVAIHCRPLLTRSSSTPWLL